MIENLADALSLARRAFPQLAEPGLETFLRIAATEPTTHTRLCETMLATGAAVSRRVSALVLAGLVYSEEVPEDRRNKHLRLTDAGLALFARLQETVAAADQARSSSCPDDTASS